LLGQLDAIKDRKITDRGREMANLPTHPRIAHMLLEAVSAGGASGALASDIAALLEERDLLPKAGSADLSLRIELLRRWRKDERVPVERGSLERVEKLAATWRRLLKLEVNNDIVPDTEVGKWLMAAYPERIARQLEKHSERYKLVNGRVARLPENDPLTRECWISVAHLDAGQQEGKIFLAAAVDEVDLIPLASEEEIVSWDEEREMVTASKELKVG